MMGGMGMPPMPGGPGGGMGNMLSTSQGNAVQSMLSEMQTLLSDKSATDDKIREKLETTRATRAKAKADLKAAEADVMELLTSKQIATLVLLGYLD
jgi:folate-dependent phosphoribosylglycinamide formyltransferase PurN